MKLLIVAGPYEADRIRRAAVSAGIEAVAVEPGESLSGWITATRPEVIVLQPQVINADPVVALAKVRSVPRGRVPILLVGEAEDEAQLRPLADGFFVRPIAADDLIAQARNAMGAVPRAIDEAGSGPQERGSGPVPGAVPGPPSGGSGRSRALRPLVAGRESGPVTDAGLPTREVLGGALPESLAAEGESSARSSLASPSVTPSSPWSAKPRRAPLAFDRLAETIDADMDADLAAELRDVVRAVGARKADQARPAAKSPSAALEALTALIEAPEPAPDALTELTDESSQKTREVPQVPKAADDETELDLPSLLARMFLARLSGRLTLRAGKVKKHVVFEHGHPVLAASTHVEDRMGAMLVRDGLLTPEQATAFGDEAVASGRRLGLVLVDHGLIPAHELRDVVRRHHEEIVYSLFSWERGSWNLGTDGSSAPEKVLSPLHPATLILEGIRLGYGASRTFEALGGPDAVFRLRHASGLSELVEKMGLDDDERRAVLLFDGRRTLAAVSAASGLPLETVCSLAWTLSVLERLEPALADAAQELTAAVSDRDEAIDRALVQARHALVVDGDYFQVLGVSRDAGVDEIRRAHDVLVAGVAAESLHPSVAAELHAELDEIRIVLDEARTLLENDWVRQQYRAHLPAGGDARPS
ncbi:MAG TPA: DUF4388 domain-containing protein [Polyangia bacterium]